METVIDYLKAFKGKQGLYIIRPKSQELMVSLCKKLNYYYSSEIAYIGKAELTKSSHLANRAKQEMGWSNFEGATFVRKIGRYLDFDIKDKTNKDLKEQTRAFICSNFTIECVAFDDGIKVQLKETEYIHKFKPCLNDKKNKNMKIKHFIFFLSLSFFFSLNMNSQCNNYYGKKTFKGNVKEVTEDGVSIDASSKILSINTNIYTKITQFNKLGLPTGYVFAHKNDNYKFTKALFKFDKKGHKIKELRYGLDNKIKNTLSYKYDHKGNEIESRYYIGNFKILDNYETDNYNEKCNLVEKINYFSDGQEWLHYKFIYENEQIIKIVEVNNNSYDLYENDSFGNSLTIKSFNDKGELENETKYIYEYDIIGNWTKRTSIENGKEVWIETRKFVYYNLKNN